MGSPLPMFPIMHHWAGAGARWWGWGGLAASGLTKDPVCYLPLSLTSLASLVCGCPITALVIGLVWPALGSFCAETVSSSSPFVLNLDMHFTSN